MPSLQLTRYLQLRANGVSVEAAAEESRIGLAEAELHEASIAAGDLQLPQPRREGMPEQDETTNENLIELTADHLRGDVRDALLSWFKATPKPWGALSEKEQRDIAESADVCARSVVKRACQHIAAAERPVIVANLIEYREKEGVEAKLKLPSKGEVVAALHEACGREVLLVTSGHEAFMGEAAPAEIDADQPKFENLGAEYEEAA